jgi:hypothetical protein
MNIWEDQQDNWEATDRWVHVQLGWKGSGSGWEKATDASTMGTPQMPPPGNIPNIAVSDVGHSTGPFGQTGPRR